MYCNCIKTIKELHLHLLLLIVCRTDKLTSAEQRCSNDVTVNSAHYRNIWANTPTHTQKSHRLVAFDTFSLLWLHSLHLVSWSMFVHLTTKHPPWVDSGKTTAMLPLFCWLINLPMWSVQLLKHVVLWGRKPQKVFLRPVSCSSVHCSGP